MKNQSMVSEQPLSQSRNDQSSKVPVTNSSSNTRLKTQIDAILQNDLSVLGRHPDTPHRALLATHNNPLIMRYVKNIYNEYRIEDPLPERYEKYKSTFEEKDVPEQPQTLKKKSPKKPKNPQQTNKKKKKIQISKNLKNSCEVARVSTEKEEERIELDRYIEEYEQTEKKRQMYCQDGDRLKTEYKNQEGQSRIERGQNMRASLSPNPRHTFVTLKNNPHLSPKQVQLLSTPPRRNLNFSYHLHPSPIPHAQRTLPTNHSQGSSLSPEQRNIENQIVLRQNIRQSVAIKASNQYFDRQLRTQENERVIQVKESGRRRPAINFIQSGQPKVVVQIQPEHHPSYLLPLQKTIIPTIPLTPQKQKMPTQPLPSPRSNTPFQYRSTVQPIKIVDQQTILISGEDESYQGHEEETMKFNVKSQESRTMGLRKVENKGKNQIKISWGGAHRPLPQIETFKNPHGLKINEQPSMISQIPESPQFFQLPRLSQLSQASQTASEMKDNFEEAPKGEEISQSFRYCIGCQQALLEVNIPSHEQKCEEFKRIVTLSPYELIAYLKTKISKFQGNIHQYSSELLEKDCEDISFHSSKMLQESRTILEEGHLNQRYSEEYEEALAVSRKWMKTSEEISKVNWFLKVREGIKKKLKI